MKVNYTEVYPFRPIPTITPASSYWQNGTWKFNMSEISAGAASQPSYIDIILKGNTALTLVNSKANGLNYLKLFGDTEQLAETYLDTVTLSGGCEQRNLPEGYTQLEYIESDGTQYIDIDVSGNATFIGTAQSTTDSSTTSQVLIANGSATAGRWFGVQSPTVGEPYSKRWGLGATATASSTIYGTTKIDFNLTFSDVDGQYGTVNNETLTRTSTKPTQGDWIAFAGAAGAENPSYGFIGKVWKLQAVQNDVLVRDFVPCKNSSNIAGMYDLVSGRFFGSSNASNFVAGPTVVPTPDAPIDIVCNNGVIKVSPNLANMVTANITVGYYINNSGVVTADANNFYYNSTIVVTPNTTYTMKISQAVRAFSIMEYSDTASSTFIKRTLYGTASDYVDTITFTTTSTTNSILFGSNIDMNAMTLEKVQAINWMLTQTDTPQTYMPYGQIYIDGTQEVVTDSLGNTASAERLLAIGDYTDTQEVLSGSVTRNVGIKVLDGTENWNASGNLFYADIATDALEDTHSCYCTHFKGVATNASATYNNEIKVGTNVTASVKWARVQMYPVVGTYSDVNAFTQWLSDQYNAGTPVIVVYPLATATTESVTPQLLLKSPVTQTAGSISNLPIAITESSHTTPTPQQPLPINCNNGVLKVSPNLFNKNIANIEGAFAQNSDTIVTNANYRIYDYSYIKAGSYVLQLNNPYGAGTATVMNLYDKSKTYLSQPIYTNSRQVGLNTWTFTVAQDGYYRLCCRYTDENIQLEQGSTATPYKPYGQIYVDGTTETVEVTGKNLLDTRSSNLAYYGASLGTLVYYSDGTRHSYILDMAKVGLSSGDTVTVSCTSRGTSSYWTVGAYAQIANNEPSLYYDNQGSDLVKTFTIPNGAHYIVVFNGSGYAENQMIERGNQATTYEEYFNGGTATAQPLYKVGNYQDIQSVLDGEVTRNVGIKVLDGTENWLQVSGSSAPFALVVNDFVSLGLGDKAIVYSTHFQGVPASTTWSNYENLISFTASSGTTENKTFRVRYLSNTKTLAEFKQFLADQYANGTPVICIYYKTPTTESVESQELTIQAGSNDVVITQASMDNLPLEVSYKAGVAVTITEIENAQLDNSVEVTIA